MGCFLNRPASRWGVLGRGDGERVTGGDKLTGSKVKDLGVWRWGERKMTAFLSSPWPCGEVDLGVALLPIVSTVVGAGLEAVQE